VRRSCQRSRNIIVELVEKVSVMNAHLNVEQYQRKAGIILSESVMIAIMSI
jgi:hypothetical protein